MRIDRALNFISFFFNDTATTDIYTLSLHDALPIFPDRTRRRLRPSGSTAARCRRALVGWTRSEEHTSELQSLRHLVCRLLLEKKKNKYKKKRKKKLKIHIIYFKPHQVENRLICLIS